MKPERIQSLEAPAKAKVKKPRPETGLYVNLHFDSSAQVFAFAGYADQTAKAYGQPVRSKVESGEESHQISLLFSDGTLYAEELMETLIEAHEAWCPPHESVADIVVD